KDAKKARFALGDEAQRLGQVLKEFTNRVNPLLREQARLNDKATAEEFRDMVNQARNLLEGTSPAGEGMKTAKNTMTKIITEKKGNNILEDVEKFSAFVSLVCEDLDDIGANFIQQGIRMCDNTVVEDGLTDFDKKYLWDCADVFRFSRIQKETECQ
ncbi:unnamed protein product, partial [Ixodes hexagonus]